MLLDTGASRMTPSSVPDAVRELVLSVVDSYEKLYVLSALVRSDSALELDSLCERVSLPRDIVHESLQPLALAGLAHQHAGGLYAYECADPDRARAVESLLELFERDPLELSRLLDRAAVERARSAIHERLTSGYASRQLRRHDRRE